MPLLFLSGVFIPLGNTPPAWMAWVGRIFPVRHFLSGMQAGFLGGPFSWTDVLVVAAWGRGCSSRSASSAGNRAQADARGHTCPPRLMGQAFGRLARPRIEVPEAAESLCEAPADGELHARVVAVKGCQVGAGQLPRRQDTGVKAVEQVAVLELADAVTLTATV